MAITALGAVYPRAILSSMDVNSSPVRIDLQGPPMLRSVRMDGSSLSASLRVSLKCPSLPSTPVRCSGHTRRRRWWHGRTICRIVGDVDCARSITTGGNSCAATTFRSGFRTRIARGRGSVHLRAAGRRVRRAGARQSITSDPKDRRRAQRPGRSGGVAQNEDSARIASLRGIDLRGYRDRLDQSLDSLNILDFTSPTQTRLTVLNDASHYRDTF